MLVDPLKPIVETVLFVVKTDKGTTLLEDLKNAATLVPPLTSSLTLGLVVPIPTLPSDNTFIVFPEGVSSAPKNVVPK